MIQEEYCCIVTPDNYREIDHFKAYHKLAFVDPDITPTNFEMAKELVRPLEMSFVRFGGNEISYKISTHEVQDYLTKCKANFPSLAHCLALTTADLNALSSFFVVILGFPWKSLKYNCNYLPYFGWSKGQRALRLAPMWDRWPRKNTCFVIGKSTHSSTLTDAA